MQMGFLDWLIIGCYLAALGTVGIVASLGVKDTGQYFLGKRRFGKLLMVAQTFGVGTHTEMPVSLSGAVYSMGISAIWYQWKNLFALPFYWVMAPVFRRFRRTTAAEMVEDRYGPAMGGLYMLFAFFFFIIGIASVLKGGAKILNEVLGGRLGVDHIVMGLALTFILYSFSGGLVASVWSNFIQGFLIIVLSGLLIPLGWSLVGGFSGMKQTLPAFDFSIATPKQIGPWFIAMLTVNGLIGIMAQPHMIANVGTGKDEYTCRVGFLHGTIIKRLCTIGWAIVGLMVAAMVKRALFGATTLSDPEEAFGFACRHLLSTGFRGLLVASVMGASLASCSALMIDTGALFTQGLYRSRLVPGQSDRHYLWVGRFSGLAAVLIAVIYALFFIQKVLYSFLLTETMATYVGISIVTGLVWKRANRWGAASSIFAALLTNFYLYHSRNERLDYWDPNIFLAALAAGLASLVIVSLLTPPEPGSRLAWFFTQLQTPSDLSTEKADGQGLVTPVPDPQERQGIADSGAEPLPWVAERGRQLLLVNLLHLRRGACGVSFFKAYRDDLKGMLVGSVVSVAIVFLLWIILHL
jgi:Na+/proline symporter